MPPTPDRRRIYLDNAATTRPEPDVVAAMLPHLQEDYGNPSSQYAEGRKGRLAIETSRKEIAARLGTKPGNLIFTSGGTESNNMAIAGAIHGLGCTHILYSPTEHHSILHPIDHYTRGGISSSPIRLDAEGRADLADLEQQLSARTHEGDRCLVCLMHANNETGIIQDLTRIGQICHANNAIYLADCVATIGHLPLTLGGLPVDLASAAAHKFHGPKGVGLLYVRPGLGLSPLLHGGGQERERRAGTENVAGVAGMATALAIALRDYEKDSQAIQHLRHHCWRQLKLTIPGVRLNSDLATGLYTILNVTLPPSARAEAALIELDQRGIACSGGSACHAGAPSHVLAALGKTDGTTIRFSFSKYNTTADIDTAVDALATILEV
jgi:cysteine desulfurase